MVAVRHASARLGYLETVPGSAAARSRTAVAEIAAGDGCKDGMMTGKVVLQPGVVPEYWGLTSRSRWQRNRLPARRRRRRSIVERSLSNEDQLMAPTSRPTNMSDPDWDYDLTKHRQLAEPFGKRLAWEAAMREQGLRPLEIYRTPEAIAAAVEAWAREPSAGSICKTAGTAKASSIVGGRRTRTASGR